MREIYIRNIVFGVLDSLVSTVALLAGLDAGGATAKIIVSTGVIYAFVEAFSMAVGSFLSEESVELGSGEGALRPVAGGVAMFVSFVLASCIPLIPYALGSTLALWYSIGISLLALLMTGLSIRLVRRVSSQELARHVSKVVLLGAAAIVLGVVIGVVLHVS